MKRLGMLMLMVALICMMGLTACGDKKIVLSAGFASGELFRVDGKPCEAKEVLLYAITINNTYKVTGEDDASRMQLSELTKETALDMVYKIKVMNLLAKTYGISLTSEEKELIKAAAKEYFDSLTSEEKAAMGGVSLADIRGYYEEYAISIKLYESLIKDVNPEISDDDARTVVVKKIFIDKTRAGGAIGAIANQAYQRAAEGEDFDLLVAEYSDDEAKLYDVRKGDLELLLEEAVFNLSNGQISSLLEASDGYYIFYCVSAADPVAIEANKRRIIEARQAEAFESIYNAYEEQRRYYLNEQLWGELVIEDGENINTCNFFDVFNSYYITE